MIVIFFIIEFVLDALYPQTLTRSALVLILGQQEGSPDNAVNSLNL